MIQLTQVNSVCWEKSVTVTEKKSVTCAQAEVEGDI